MAFAEECDEHKTSIDRNRHNALIYAAQFVHDKMLPRDYASWLETVFAPLTDKPVVDPRLLNTIAALQAQGAIIITTNYDHVLEQALPDKQSLESSDTRLSLFFDGKVKGVLHMHGDYQRPTNVVMTVRQYSAGNISWPTDEMIAATLPQTLILIYSLVAILMAGCQTFI